MKNIKTITPFILLILATFLASCASTSEPVAVEEEEEQIIVPETDTFYFEFDQSDIDPADFAILDQHAEAIQAKIGEDSGLLITIEGHCDERGSEEYNQALGNRRAEAVSRYLRVRGVPAENLATISYGELNPVNFASNEDAWAQNRRSVVLSY